MFTYLHGPQKNPQNSIATVSLIGETCWALGVKSEKQSFIRRKKSSQNSSDVRTANIGHGMCIAWIKVPDIVFTSRQRLSGNLGTYYVPAQNSLPKKWLDLHVTFLIDGVTIYFFIRHKSENL